MNLILLCVSSIFLGRYLEKKMRVASVAHSVLFIFCSFLFLFNSGFKLIDTAMINIFGEEIFYIVQDTLIATSKIHNVVISSFLMIEFFNYIMTSLVAVVVIIKGFKKLLEKYRVRLVTYVPQAKKVINIAP